MAAVERLKPKRVVFDSLSEIAAARPEPAALPPSGSWRQKDSADCGCTVLSLDDRSATSDDLQLHSIAHGVISSSNWPIVGPERRHLRG